VLWPSFFPKRPKVIIVLDILWIKAYILPRELLREIIRIKVDKPKDTDAKEGQDQEIMIVEDSSEIEVRKIKFVLTKYLISYLRRRALKQLKYLTLRPLKWDLENTLPKLRNLPKASMVTLLRVSKIRWPACSSYFFMIQNSKVVIGILGIERKLDTCFWNMVAPPKIEAGV